MVVQSQGEREPIAFPQLDDALDPRLQLEIRGRRERGDDRAPDAHEPPRKAAGSRSLAVPSVPRVEAHADASGSATAHQFTNEQRLRQKGTGGVCRHPIDEHHLGGVRPPRRLDDRGIVEVTAFGFACLERRDVEAPSEASGDKSAEHRRRIESREAQPVDRTGRRDERGCPRVSDQPVLADRGKRRRIHSLSRTQSGRGTARAPVAISTN
jgi:hypothetical protein